jgi:TonB-linked SusC/RagA family outer membrane protein
MKISLSLLFAVLLNTMAAPVTGQNSSFKINMRNVIVRDVLKEVENKTGYRFFFSDDFADIHKTVSINVESDDVTELLSQIFQESTITYKILENNVVVITPVKTERQGITVTGTVTDAQGEPLPGVNIRVQNSITGTTTDVNGRYSIVAPGEQSVLQFSFIGFNPQDIVVGDQRVVNVQLEENVQELDEVVVVGYGTVRKSDLTGAVSRISAKDITSRPVTNPVQAMQGKLAGVDIASNSRPGMLGQVRVRGDRSITASNDPLYVVDGIPLFNGTDGDAIMGSAITGGSPAAAEINPVDIESIEVLKDASATAIYGSRAANGVILITTKKGAAGRTHISYDGSVSFSRIHSLTDWMDSGDKLNWQRQERITAGTYNGAYGNAPDPARDYEYFMGSADYMRRILETAYQLDGHDPKTPVLRAATAEEIAMGYGNADGMVPVYDAGKLYQEDWTNYVLRTGVSQNHNLSVSMGTDRAALYASMGYMNDKSPMKDQNYERFSTMMNGSVTPLKWLKISNVLNGNYSIRNYGVLDIPTNNGGAKDSYGQALNLQPYAPAYDENGNLIFGLGRGLSALNPINNIQHGYNEYRAYNMSNNFSAEATLLPWLKYQYRIGAQYRHQRQGSFYDPEWVNPVNGAAATDPLQGYTDWNTRFNWEMENLLFAHKEFGKHVLDVTALQSASHQRHERIWIRSLHVTYPTSKWYSLQNNADNKAHGYQTGFDERKLASYMMRVNYSFNDRYLLTASARWDGSSVLAQGHKWDFFPSAALAWKMEQEGFIREVPWIQQLKLRLGYGITGSQAIGPYQTMGSIGDASMSFNNKDVVGVRANLMQNPALGWEKTAQSNVGLDFGLFNFRINGSLELYNAVTSDLLLSRAIPSVLGYNSVTSNIGKTRNRGIEVTLSTVNVQTGDFTWRTDLNFSRNREAILELSMGKQDEPGSSRFIGHPQTTVWNKQVDRLWQDTPEDQELMDIYRAISGSIYYPGMVKLVDQQPMIEVAPGTEGSKDYTINGEQRAFMDNGFGNANTTDDNVILGSRRPDWTGGMTNTFTYRNWSFNFFIHARVGGLYHGLMHTYGRRVELDTWSPTNTGAKFPMIGTPSNATSHNDLLNWTSATMYSVRNVTLSYTFPKPFLDRLKLSSGSVYVQALNPFIFGSELIRIGINPDETTGWGTTAGGGLVNNTMQVRSYVIGLRLEF